MVGVLIPAALSGTAELSQLVLRPERFATWVDVATNTSGAAFGAALAVVVMAITGRGGPRSRAWRRRRARNRGRGRAERIAR
ncbi:hypothetical protein [Cellulomonas sp. ATA003]|uniref:hypothetical protein n=1 Tax=Cellulomonas sp. ATA003 TaxID=3073064 RepID=UPI0028732691|nr:hypothetical protein [Cellulomonas sp. ATA003]WNB85177.1 hypothetical protein REH70_16295 [Cellulomonas sp. ATA003]